MTYLFKLQEWANAVDAGGFPVYPDDTWAFIADVYDHDRDRWPFNTILYRSEFYFWGL